MAEPTTSTSAAFILSGIIGSLLGPIYGPAIMMVFAAFMGGLLAMSRSETQSTWQAIQFVAVAVGISMVLTGAGIWIIEKFTPLPGSVALMPVAFTFAAARESLLHYIDRLFDVFASIIQRKGGA